MRFHLARMLAREAGTRDGRDLEDLHAMRVATRRQRAAWRVFGSTFRDRTDTAVSQRTARDRESAGGRPRPRRPASRQPTSTGRTCRSPNNAPSSRSSTTGGRGGTTPGSCLSASSIRTGTSAGSMTIATSSRPKAPPSCRSLPTQPHRVRDTAASRIWAAYEQVRAYEPVLRWADVETLHELRISGKWLRYTLEFVRDALGDDAAPLIARVTALQDHLGLMNDADVSASLARTFLVEHAGELSGIESAAIGRYLVEPREGGRPAAPDGRADVAGSRRRHLPARPRPGRRRPLDRRAALGACQRAPAARELGSGGRATRRRRVSTTRTVPSRTPESETVHRFERDSDRGWPRGSRRRPGRRRARAD